MTSALGRSARRLETALMALPAWLLPGFLIEAVARSVSLILSIAAGPSRLALEKRLRGVLCAPRFKQTGLRIGRGVLLDGANIQLGQAVTLNEGVYLSATGPFGAVSVGPGSHIDVNCVLYGQGGIRVGAGCAISGGVLIYSQTNQYNAAPQAPIIEQGTRYQSVAIGEDVWVGAGAVILPGVSIGDHAVVGAGAVVTRDLEPWSIAVGVPARRVADRREARSAGSAAQRPD